MVSENLSNKGFWMIFTVSDFTNDKDKLKIIPFLSNSGLFQIFSYVFYIFINP